MYIVHIYVFDLDETMVHVVGKNIYVRPYIQHVLYNLWKKRNIYCILWSAGDESYVLNTISTLNWHHYFIKVLTRQNCEISAQLFGSYKSRYYLDRTLNPYLRKYNKLHYTFIDDNAYKNCEKGEYDSVIEIPPYLGGHVDFAIYNYFKNNQHLSWSPNYDRQVNDEAASYSGYNGKEKNTCSKVSTECINEQ
jgi:hypothetical protein